MPKVTLVTEMHPAPVAASEDEAADASTALQTSAPSSKNAPGVLSTAASKLPAAKFTLEPKLPVGKGSWNESFADELAIRVKKMTPTEVVALKKEVKHIVPHPVKTDEDALHIGVSDLRLSAESDQILQKDLTSTSSAHSVSNEELPANALSKVKLSGSDVATAGAPTAIKNSTSTTAPNMKPTSNSQPREKPKPSLDNPSYASNMTFAIAAGNIVAYYHEASSWLAHWHETSPADTLVEISRKPTSTLNRIFKNLLWTWEFLLFKHAHWNLLHLPDQFFEDVLPLVDVTMQKVGWMEEWKGCALIMGKALRDVEGTREMLLIIRAARVKEGKDRWARSLGPKGSQVLDGAASDGERVAASGASIEKEEEVWWFAVSGRYSCRLCLIES